MNKLKAPWFPPIACEDKHKQVVSECIDKALGKCPSGQTFCSSTFRRELKSNGLQLMPNTTKYVDSWGGGKIPAEYKVVAL